MLSKASLPLILVVLCCSFILFYSAASAQTSAAPFDSPLPPPATPIATPVTPEVEVALQFIAEREGIARDRLASLYQETVSFPTLGRSYLYVTARTATEDGYQFFQVLVDPKTMTVEPDYKAVRAAENAAYNSKYGKLNPELYERLQSIDEEEVLPVSIWVARPAEDRSQETIEAEIIARYPEAKEALAQKGVLWAVANPELAVEIQVAYEQLLTGNVRERVQPLVTHLEEQGFNIKESAGMPTLTADLPKHIIINLSKRSDVAEIFLIEATETPAVESALPTDRAPQVWARGITGAGSRLAILERNNINATAAACLNIVETRPSTADLDGHKSKVAAVAACNDPVLRGMASGVQLLDAGNDGNQPDVVEALKWATDPYFGNHAHVVNHSASFGNDNVLHLTDRAYDYWIKARWFTAIVAAGNTAANVTSPAKAFNVITVGNVNDNNTSSWSDDVMRDTSSYANPNTGVEKPEVAAPGTDLSTIAGPASGTSFAAPQVAGLAALLMQRDQGLRNWPSAVKAIIMASAVHNIEGNRTLSDRDGAGSIDAALADQIAQTEGGAGACSAPCWWSFPTTNSYPAVNSGLQRTFMATRGEDIRVVIAWHSQADAPVTDTSLDRLFRNFELVVYTPDNTLAAISYSPTNNFEIVDFTAPATGQYTIVVWRNGAGDLGNEPGGNLLGIAWSKQATYLPQVIQNFDNWSTSIMVRNESPQSRPLRISFQHIAQAGGGHAFDYNTTLTAGQEWVITPASSLYGSAVVNGSEDLAVSVALRRAPALGSDYHISAAYAGVTSMHTANASYVPLVLRKKFTASDISNSTLYIQNAGSSTVSISIQLIALPNSGKPNYTKPPFDIQPGASYLYSLEAESPLNVPDDWAGSAVVYTSGETDRSTVVSELKSGQATLQSMQGFTAEHATNTWYIPLFTSRLTNGLSTPVTIQNLSVAQAQFPVASIVLDCTPAAGSSGSTFVITNAEAVPPAGAYSFNPVVDYAIPGDWFGACTLTAPDTGVTFVQMRNVGAGNPANAAAYEAMPANAVARQVVFPLIQKRLSDGSATTVSVQNLSPSQSTDLTFHYMGACGLLCPDFTLQVVDVAPETSVQHNHRLDDLGIGYDDMNDGWYGSLVVVSSGQPIDGFSQLTNLNMNNLPGDLFLAYKGITP